MEQTILQKQEKHVVNLYAIGQAPLHTHLLSEDNRGECMEGELNVQTSVLEIEGKCGTITVQASTEESTNTTEDIHGLIARILLMKQKRLSQTG